VTDLVIPTARVFRPLLQPARYKGAYGGRGSGKSRFFASLLVESHVADPDRSTVCIREVQKSLAQSVKRLVEQTIEELGVGHLFEVQEAVIKSRRGRGIVIFQGMQNHTAESIKSLEGYDCAWVEEAQALSQRSLDLLRPTIRKPGSELWFSWNPRRPDDAVDAFLRRRTPPDAIVVEANADDNPWLPDVLRRERQTCLELEPEKYGHIWGGEYQTEGGRVYQRFRREVHCASPPAVKVGKGRIAIACDFNVRYMHWLIVEVDDETKRAHVVGEVIKEGGTTTDEHAERVTSWIASYLTRTRGRAFSADDVRRMKIKAYVDASGGRLTSTSSVSDIHLLIRAGYQPKCGTRNPRVVDRVVTVNTLLRDRRITVDDMACPVLTRALETQGLDANGEPEKSGNIDHGVDALGYFAWWEWPVFSPTPSTKTAATVDVDEWGRVS
jgi:phage terminase large subunit